MWPAVAGHTEAGTELRLMVVDNLPSQTGRQFRVLAREKSSTLLIFVPPNCTDMLQPVDANIAKLVQDFVKRKYEVWSEDKTVHERMREDPYSLAERRKLTVQWVAEAIEKKLTPKVVQRAFRKTGTYIAADGSTDAEVQPQHATKKFGYTFDHTKVERKASPDPRLQPFAE